MWLILFLVLSLVGIQATVSSQDVGTETTVMLQDMHLVFDTNKSLNVQTKQETSSGIGGGGGKG